MPIIEKNKIKAFLALILSYFIVSVVGIAIGVDGDYFIIHAFILVPISYCIRVFAIIVGSNIKEDLIRETNIGFSIAIVSGMVLTVASLGVFLLSAV